MRRLGGCGENTLRYIFRDVASYSMVAIKSIFVGTGGQGDSNQVGGIVAGSTRCKLVPRQSFFSGSVTISKGAGGCCVVRGSYFICGPEGSGATPCKPFGYCGNRRRNVVSPLCAYLVGGVRISSACLS